MSTMRELFCSFQSIAVHQQPVHFGTRRNSEVEAGSKNKNCHVEFVQSFIHEYFLT